MTGDFVNPSLFSSSVAIYEDGGGLVSKYMEAAMRYRAEKREVRIMGSCRSACIMALSVPNVCVGPNAVVKAHHAYNQQTGEVMPVTTMTMLSYLPWRVQVRLVDNVKKEYTPGATLNADQLAELGIRRCGMKVTGPTVAQDRKPIRVKITDPVTKFLDATIGKIGVK